MGGINNEASIGEAEVIELAEDGLGFGEGSIGVQERLADSSDGLSMDVMAKVKQGLRDNNSLVMISKGDDNQPIKDDGCGDGRGVADIFDQQREYSKSLYRPKVFGGGATMAFSVLIGLGETKDKPADELFSIAVEGLNAKGIEYGGHSDENASGGNCGCGVIDKCEEIIGNVAKYGEQIADSTFSVARAVSDDSETLGEDIDEIMDNFRAYAGNCNGKSKGSDKLNLIKGSGKVIKKLEGDHKEVAIALNTVENHTVDQQYIRNLSGGEAQVFAVDIWRLNELCQDMFPGSEAQQRKALLSMVVYTLGTSATLTKGDLPVDMIVNKT